MSERTLLSPWPLVGHELVVSRLARLVTEEQVAHAYLFGGPAQIGKREVARTFARALLCGSGSQRPCGECRSCRLVGSNRHPDLLTLDMDWQATVLPDKKGARSITVDAVRLMNAELNRRPHEGRWKILLVPHIEELTVAAANAFLKTLEEPPTFVVILLTTRDPELVLPTIRSRCQPLSLLPLPIEQVEEALCTRWGAEEERARLLARLSGGRIGWAIEALQEPAIMEGRARALAELERALASNRAERLLSAGALSKENDLEVIRLWAGWWRDVLLLQNQAADRLINIDQREKLQQAATRYTPSQVRDFLHELQRLLHLASETNVNPQLLWEVLLLKLPKE